MPDRGWEQLSLLAEPAAAPRGWEGPEAIRIAGRRLPVSPVFGTYWHFAAARQAIYEARLAGLPGPWTDDPTLLGHRFTNCFRAADRVSQFLIREVAYQGPQEPRDVVFRVLLFRAFNKIATWRLLEDRLGPLTWSRFDLGAYDRVLGDAVAAGVRPYSPAYVIPPPPLGAARKHTNLLRLLRDMMKSGITGALQDAATMRAAFVLLRGFPGLGNFLAYQWPIDINYCTVLGFSEMEFVVAGPGARDGIRKCFGPAAAGIEGDIIRYMAEHQGEHFARLGLRFGGLRGRPLQLIDCQNLFCEVDKYSRVKHPDITVPRGRTKIKQRFTPAREPVPAWFPPKWNLPGGELPAAASTAAGRVKQG